MAEINTSVPAGLQLDPCPPHWFARKVMAWDYPVSRSRVDAFYCYYFINLVLLIPVTLCRCHLSTTLAIGILITVHILGGNKLMRFGQRATQPTY